MVDSMRVKVQEVLDGKRKRLMVGAMEAGEGLVQTILQLFKYRGNTLTSLE